MQQFTKLFPARDSAEIRRSLPQPLMLSSKCWLSWPGGLGRLVGRGLVRWLAGRPGVARGLGLRVGLRAAGARGLGLRIGLRLGGGAGWVCKWICALGEVRE